MTVANRRPVGVPADAFFHTSDRLWHAGKLDAHQRRSGAWTAWTGEGLRAREAEFLAGALHGSWRCFHPTGQIREEGAYRQGKRDGAWRRYDLDGNLIAETCYCDGVEDGPYFRAVPAGHYRDPRVRGERGRFVAGRATGPLVLLDDEGAVLHTVELGRAAPREAPLASPAFDDAAREPRHWVTVAQALLAEKRTGEALCAAARASAASRDIAALEGLLSEYTAPLSSAEARRAADAIAAGAAPETLPDLVDALVRGADAPAMFLAISSALQASQLGHAAGDLARAASYLGSN